MAAHIHQRMPPWLPPSHNHPLRRHLHRSYLQELEQSVEHRPTTEVVEVSAEPAELERQGSASSYFANPYAYWAPATFLWMGPMSWMWGWWWLAAASAWGNAYLWTMPWWWAASFWMMPQGPAFPLAMPQSGWV